MHYYTYGTTNNEFLQRKYCEQSKILVHNHFLSFKILLAFHLEANQKTPAVSLCVSFGSVYHDTYRKPYVSRYIVKRYIVAPLRDTGEKTNVFTFYTSWSGFKDGMAGLQSEFQNQLTMTM